MDYVNGVHQGFAFVEFAEEEDADEAIFNMDGSELLGRTLKVSLAQPNQASKYASGSSMNEPIWKSDEWFQKNVSGQNKEAIEEQRRKEQDVKTLQEV
jgi:peptidyl-prolyl isomerase E (cyclophilin E)